MVARLLAWAGIDPVQWRALVVAGIRLDFRSPGAVEGGAAGVQRLLAIASMNLVLGLALGAIALFVPDVFVSGSLVLTVTMFLVAVSIVMEFAVVVISPLDYDVLGYQPISGPTYLAARIANVLFYTSVITTALAILPIGAFFFARGFNPLLGIAGIAAVYLGCLTTTLAMVALYVATARHVHPQRLRRVLTYVQLVASFSIYGGYFLLPHVFKPAALRGWTVSKSAWMLLYPPTWFASYLDLAAGRWSLLEVLPALFSVAVLASLTQVVARRLSLDYSETLSRQTARSEGTRPGRMASSPGRFLRGERRAVALLMRAQFRNDQRFRLGVLSMVPLSLFYLLMALKDGDLLDPFVARANHGSGMLLYFAVLFIPMMLQLAVGRSDAFRAAWIFYVTPARRADLVMAAKDLTVAFLLAPYLLLLAIILSYFFGSVVHAFLHLVVQGLLANLFLLAVVWLQPTLPFSLPVQKGQQSAAFFAVVIAGGIAQPLSALFLSAVVYPHPARVVAIVAVLVAAAVGGQTVLRRRLERSAAELEFLV
jgi:ABC-2 type transport system permease protein